MIHEKTEALARDHDTHQSALIAASRLRLNPRPNLRAALEEYQFYGTTRERRIARRLMLDIDGIGRIGEPSEYRHPTDEDVREQCETDR